jgi:hypothetical protein
MRFHKFLELTISHILVVNALNLVIGVPGNAILQKIPVLKIAEVAIREQGRHSIVCRISCIFLTNAHSVELRRIQCVNIYNNISDIAISNDRILEIKMATAMFEVANTPECYPDDKEDILTEL